MITSREDPKEAPPNPIPIHQDCQMFVPLGARNDFQALTDVIDASSRSASAIKRCFGHEGIRRKLPERREKAVKGIFYGLSQALIFYFCGRSSSTRVREKLKVHTTAIKISQRSRQEGEARKKAKLNSWKSICERNVDALKVRGWKRTQLFLYCFTMLLRFIKGYVKW